MKTSTKLNVSSATCNYLAPFIIAVILGIIGGACMANGLRYDHFYKTMLPTPLYYFGLIVTFVSIIADLVALKAFLTDAHVKALEVFYGKERAIK